MDELSIKDNGEPEPEGQSAEPLAQVKVIPWITYAVIAICGVIFALGLDKESLFYIRLSRILVPRGDAIWKGAYWGLLTSALVHGAFWHILFNMWWLKDFGALLEPTMGRVKYLLFIIAAAIVSSGAELAHTNDTGIGFSGVVYAMFGYALAARHIIPLYQQLVTKQTIVWLLGWLVLCIILTVTGVWNIANGSHIAGFFFGYCIGNAFTARAYVTLSRLGLLLLITMTALSATYLPWSYKWLVYSGNHAAAIKVLTGKISKNYDHPVAYYNRGYSYFKLNDYQKAIKDFDKAIELDPSEPDVYRLRGVVYDQLGDHQHAIQDFDKAISLKPTDSWAYHGRALSYLEVGNYQQAIKDFDRAIEIDGNNPVFVDNRGIAYAKNGKLQEAIKNFDRAIALDPRDGFAYYNRSKAYIYLHNCQQAISDLDHVVELNPIDAVVHNGLAWIMATSLQQECRNGAKAITHGQKACDLTNWQKPTYIDTLAAAYAETGDFAEAVRWQKKVLEFQGLPEKDIGDFQKRLQLYNERKPYREK